MIGEGEEWLEILGSGMVHPRVLQGVGIDPKNIKVCIWNGFRKTNYVKVWNS